MCRGLIKNCALKCYCWIKISSQDNIRYLPTYFVLPTLKSIDWHQTEFGTMESNLYLLPISLALTRVTSVWGSVSGCDMSPSTLYWNQSQLLTLSTLSYQQIKEYEEVRILFIYLLFLMWALWSVDTRIKFPTLEKSHHIRHLVENEIITFGHKSSKFSLYSKL